MRPREIIQKQVWLDEIEHNPELLDSIFEDIEENYCVYFICRENPPKHEKGEYQIMGVLTPVDYNPHFHPKKVYEGTVHGGGIMDLPLHLMDELDWNIGDTLELRKNADLSITIKKQE